MKKVNFKNVFTLLLAAAMLFGSVSCSKSKKSQKTQEPVKKEAKMKSSK